LPATLDGLLTVKELLRTREVAIVVTGHDLKPVGDTATT
jgi:hypothetical protein